MGSFLRIAVLVVLFSSTSWSALTEDWLTIFPDTGRVLQLFGPRSPARWHLNGLGAEVPGDVLSDLMRAGEIDDPYVDRNFFSQRRAWMGPRQLWNNSNDPFHLERRSQSWEYECIFDISPNDNDLILVIEGLKMGAIIAFDGFELGKITNQFLRYEFNLEEALQCSKHQWSSSSAASAERSLMSPRRRKHKLSITFAPTISTDGRFQACSGGWDWAPYSRSGDEMGSRTFSFGIWKPLYIIEQAKASITYVVPKITYLGDEVNDYPREPMVHGSKYDFRVDVDVHLSAADPLGLVIVKGNFTNSSMSVSSSSTLVSVSLIASKEDIELWWPAGKGDQPLYTLQVSYKSTERPLQTEWVTKLIGFRTIDLVTINDTDTDTVNRSLGEEGSGDHGMFFRVNGAVTWARGANAVPMDQLEGRLTDAAHREMVHSAVEAGMNMIRVWGGGMVMPQSFYSACDQLGILVYQDLMFVEDSNHGAKNTPVVEKEIRHLVRSLSSHPSVAIWSGCNECVVEMETDTSIYATFVMQTVGEEDPTRALLPSSPSKTGWKTGVKKINGKPNGGPLATFGRHESKSKHTIEAHGPYRRGISKDHPSMNERNDQGIYDSNTPPILTFETSYGPGIQSTFTSEFGISTWSSFESVSATLSESEWSLHGSGDPDTCHRFGWTTFNLCTGDNVLAERNYACDSHLEKFFGPASDFDVVGEAAFQSQLFRCLMSTTLWLKGQIELMRARNSFGMLLWQLNENWPTGGWGCLEYGSGPGQKGQSIGGRWKPMMHVLKNHLFVDVFATCGHDQECYVRNDSNRNVSITIVLDYYDLESGALIESATVPPLDLSGDGSLARFEASRENIIPQREALLISIQDADSSKWLMRENVVLWTEPLNLIPSAPDIDVQFIAPVKSGGVNVTLCSDELALYVVLTTSFEGRFEDNAFVLHKDIPKTVSFVPPRYHSTGGSSIDVAAFEKALRVEHLLQYLS